MFNIIFKVEKWKYNIEYGVYVSSEGRIKSKSKVLIKPRTTNSGYLIIRLDGKKILIHRLVMYTFKPTENMGDLTVDHLDHNKKNNSLKNLEWVTKEENIRRATEDFDNVTPKELNISNRISCPYLKEIIEVNGVEMTYDNFIDFFWNSPVINGMFKNKKAFVDKVIKWFQLDKPKEQRGKIKKSFCGVAIVRTR